MVTFSAALAHVKEHLDQCLPESSINGVCRELGQRFRKRKLDPAFTVQLFLLQLLAQVSLRGLRRVADISVSAQALCAAKLRLSASLFVKLIELALPKDLPASKLYKNFKVYLTDGLSFNTPDTPELAKKYTKPKNQRGTTRGYPAPKALMLMEAGAGFIRRAIILPWSRQEFTCLSRLFKALDPRSLLLGDRALVSFTHLVLLADAGAQGCFRLPRKQVLFGRGKARGSRKLKQRLGRQDKLVTWTATTCPDWMSEKRWQAICGRTLTLRQISFRVCRKGHRTHWAWIITTLLDPVEYPPQELVELYGERWQIEVYFRDLKKTLKMDLVSARTVAGVQKEVLAFVLLYNLIRKVIYDAALAQGVTPDRISFRDAMLWLLHAKPGAALPVLVVNPRRSRDAQPRKVKNGRRRFAQLNDARAELCKPPCLVML